MERRREKAESGSNAEKIFDEDSAMSRIMLDLHLVVEMSLCVGMLVSE